MTELAALPTVRPQRLVYLGTPAMAVPALEALVAHGFDVVLVVTRADKRRGRGSELMPSPVKSAALRLGLEVSHRVEDALDRHADLGVVVAFGQLIKPHVLSELPMLNLHFSLLPRWRGAAPVERALLAGDAVTGVCLMQIDEGLDTGPVLSVVDAPIGERETADELRSRLVTAGTDLLIKALVEGLPTPRPQVGGPSYAAKLQPDEFAINWHSSAVEINRLVRLGVAWTSLRGKRLKVLMAEPTDLAAPAGTFLEPCIVGCGSGALVLVQVQPEGKPVMDAGAWANGARPRRGEQFDERASA